MPVISYVTAGPPWWSAARLNALISEFDRKLSLILAGKTPYLLSGYGGTPGAGADISGNLPIFYSGAADQGAGVVAPGNLYGPAYVFKGGGAADNPVVYFALSKAWSQSAFDTWANGLTEVSHDAATGTVKVDTTDPTFLIEQTLRVNTRDISGQPYRLWANNGTPDRALRRHQYACAELVAEGLPVLAVSRLWDRYQCFRVHNLGRLQMTVTVEMAEGDPDRTFTVPPYGCRAFRRIIPSSYFDNSLNYSWRARAGEDKRFLMPTGPGWPEASAAINPFAEPFAMLRWFRALNGERDPAVTLPDAYSMHGEKFDSPNNPASLVGDLIAHKGAILSRGWLLGDPDHVDTPGEFTGHANLVADLAPIGVTVTIAGDNVTLSRAAVGAPGEPGSGLDVLAGGTNLLWCPDQTVSAPGSTTEFVPQRMRTYTPLPVTLIPTVSLRFEGTRFNRVTTGTAQWSESGRWESIAGPTVNYRLVDANEAAVGRMATAASLNASAAGPDANTLSPWSLTPEGFALKSTFKEAISESFTHAIGFVDAGHWWRTGLYGSVDGSSQVNQPALALIDAPGWSTLASPFGFPPYPQRHGEMSEVSGVIESGDWDGEQASADGGEPVATGKTTTVRPDLAYLRNPGAPLVLDHSSAPRYQVFYQPDEGQSAIAHPLANWRVAYAAGRANTDRVFWRRLMLPEDHNLIAWTLNAWRRSRLVMDVSLVWLRRGTGGQPQSISPMITGGVNPWPFNAYRLVMNPADVAGWQALGLTVLGASSAQNWTAAKDVLHKRHQWRRARVGQVGGVTTVYLPRSPAGPGLENVQVYYDWSVTGTPGALTDSGPMADGGNNFDFDVWSPLAEADPWHFIELEEVQRLAVVLGMPCYFEVQGVAARLEVFPQSLAVATSDPLVDHYRSPLLTYTLNVGDPDRPLPALPSTAPEMVTEDVEATNTYTAQVRFVAPALPSEAGWLVETSQPVRFMSSVFIWQSRGRQLYGQGFPSYAPSTWNPWANLNLDLYPNGSLGPVPVTPPIPPTTGPAFWMYSFGLGDVFADRDAQLKQSLGVQVRLAGYPGAVVGRTVVRGPTWWKNYTDGVRWNPGDPGAEPVPPGTIFGPTGTGNAATLTPGFNLVAASIDQAFGVLLSGAVYVDLV